MIAGGLADGSVCLWNPAAVLEGGAGKNPLLAKMQKHGGPVSLPLRVPPGGCCLVSHLQQLL